MSLYVYSGLLHLFTDSCKSMSTTFWRKYKINGLHADIIQHDLKF